MVAIRPHSLKALRALDADIDRIVNEYGVPCARHRPAVEPVPLARFGALARIITEQQISLAAGIAIFGRFTKLYQLPDQTQAPKSSSTPLLDIPRIAKAQIEEMKSVGLSAQKARYIQDLAQRVECGKLDLDNLEQYDSLERRKMLQAVKGIGPWSCECFCLFELGEEDAWPSGDIAVLEGIRRLKKMSTRPGIKEGDRLAMAWKPYRGIAARLMWHIYLIEVRNATPGGGGDSSACEDREEAEKKLPSPSKARQRRPNGGSARAKLAEEAAPDAGEEGEEKEEEEKERVLGAKRSRAPVSSSRSKGSRDSESTNKAPLISQCFRVRKSARLAKVEKDSTGLEGPPIS